MSKDSLESLNQLLCTLVVNCKTNFALFTTALNSIAVKHLPSEHIVIYALADVVKNILSKEQVRKG